MNILTAEDNWDRVKNCEILVQTESEKLIRDTANAYIDALEGHIEENRQNLQDR